MNLHAVNLRIDRNKCSNSIARNKCSNSIAKRVLESKYKTVSLRLELALPRALF